MVSPNRAEDYSRDQARVVTLVTRDLNRWWAGLDITDAVAVRVAAQAFMRELLATYGPISATVAADYYDEIREASTARGRYAARLVDALSEEQLDANVRYAVGPLFGAQPDSAKALALLASSAQRLVQEYGRQTLISAADNDPARPRFARVPHGKPCAFCRLVASRGAIYLSSQSAGELTKFHDDCDCQIVASFAADDLPYDPEALYSEYLAARGDDFFDTKAILARMREQQGIS